MDTLLKKLALLHEKETFTALEEYAQEISTKFSFPELNEGDNRGKLWKSLYDILKVDKLQNCHKLCFQIIRILSREKEDLNKLVTKELLDVILYNAGLKENKDISSPSGNSIALEALMCLCNITYNANLPRELCCKNGTIEVILSRLNLRNVSMDIKHFDVKILFIITALCEGIRSTLKTDMNGLLCMVKYLESILSELKESNHNSDVTKEVNKLNVVETNLIIEILKTLFNLTMSTKHQKIMDEDEERYCFRLVAVLRDLLLMGTEDVQKKIELNGHIIHLLLNMPDHTLKSLLTPGEEKNIQLDKNYEHYNMCALYEILEYLKNRVNQDPIVKNQMESLMPILSAMIKLAKSDRIIRKYLRLQILPPLRDTHTRPEQGNTIRNSLCRLLTSPVTEVRDLSADLLFILCKENVSRMIKYTGYGNAAGMFASRGLLSGGNGDTQNYSSGDENSDTEEYNEFKHGINPVTGCYQEPKPSPTVQMTEEQKEYEAMKLVNLMDNLTRQGVVKPCRIGADGKPEPIEHVLQLQEELPKQQINRSNSTEDD